MSQPGAAAARSGQASPATQPRDRGWEIVPLDEAPLDGVLAALDRTFGPGHDEAWFAWKHRNNPFGPSLGWAAVAPDGGVLGVRLLMRWRLTGRGGEIEALRPVDAATVPEARRRGLFTALVEHAVGAADDSGAALLFNNPNRESRSGYERLGWTLLPPLGVRWHPVTPGRREPLIDDDPAADELSALAAIARAPLLSCWSTARSRRWLAWRYGTGSGRGYRAVRLAADGASDGLVYRLERRRGVRVLVALELTGPPAERRRLALAAARRERAAAILTAGGGPGTTGGLGGLSLRRPGAVLAVRALAALEPDPALAASWTLSLGDLEGVV